MNIEISDNFRRKLLIAYSVAVLCGGVIALCLYSRTDTQSFKTTVTGEEHAKKAKDCVNRASVAACTPWTGLRPATIVKFDRSIRTGMSVIFSAKGNKGTVNFRLLASEAQEHGEWKGVWKVDVSADNQIMFDRAVAFLHEKIPPHHPITSETQPGNAGGGLAN